MFLESFGMHLSARTDDALYMRGTDTNHHVHVCHLGDPGFVGLAFQATAEQLETLAAATGIAVERSLEPGGGVVVHLQDPDGRVVDGVAGIDPLAPLPLRVHAATKTGESRLRLGTLQRVEAGPAQVKRFGHAAIKTASLASVATWYHDTLGLLISDDLWIESPDQPNGRFMRCDRGDKHVDHHSLLIIETGESKLGHCAWEVADFDDLMYGHETLAAAGYQPYWGIGRHVLGGQVFDYWKDPLGFTVEHWTDSDLLNSSTPAGSRFLFEPINQWGPNPPGDLDF